MFLCVEDLKFTFLKNLVSFRFTIYFPGDLGFILNQVVLSAHPIIFTQCNETRPTTQRKMIATLLSVDHQVQFFSSEQYSCMYPNEIVFLESATIFSTIVRTEICVADAFKSCTSQGRRNISLHSCNFSIICFLIF